MPSTVATHGSADVADAVKATAQSKIYLAIFDRAETLRMARMIRSVFLRRTPANNKFQGENRLMIRSGTAKI